MFSAIFLLFMFIVFGKLFFFGIKACWGITRFVFTVILLPLFLIILVISGLVYLALPILIIVGIIALLCND